jgi:hypothetical protein
MLTTACSLGLSGNQPAIFFSQNKPTTSNEPVLLFSQNKSAPATSQMNQYQSTQSTIASQPNRVGFIENITGTNNNREESTT